MCKNLLIFTDLDGTLLDYHTYSFEPALLALKQIKKRGIPLIICTSKTRAEIEVYQEKLKNSYPFISENGGAIFISEDYFRSISSDLVKKKRSGYLVRELGTSYEILRNKLFEITHKFGHKVRGFGDMSVKEIREKYGLNSKEASLAKKREYDEPFYFITSPDKKTLNRIEKEFSKYKLNMFKGGRLFHLTGKNDKGKAVRILKKMYEKEWKKKAISIGLGDSFNDLPMLLAVDIPVLVKLHSGKYEERVLKKLKKPFLAKGIGSDGWNQAVLQLLEWIEDEK
ncbi:MAG: HAD-IIB family hydrolase [candidate division Zixibacteria bacterium]|nr:HAD-IIB family hydrolase [candidate division Zixibacteria bacterium]